MAVKIRLRRIGAKKRPFYRLVVADARSPRDGRFIEAIGTYDPLASPVLIKIDAERVKEWMSKGARPTDVARQLLVAEGVLPRSTREYPKVEPKAKLNKKALARQAAPPVEAPVEAAAAAETSPAEEAAPAAETAPVDEAAPVAEVAVTPEAALPAEKAEAPEAVAVAPEEPAGA